MRLDHTAALVMSWAAPLYQDGPSAEFVGQLDLSNGEELLARCHDICPWYGEVIRHRKHFVKCLIEDELTSGAVPSQVVIPAAGSSPLALELLLNQRLRVKRVIEVDIAGRPRSVSCIPKWRRIWLIALPVSPQTSPRESSQSKC